MPQGRTLAKIIQLREFERGLIIGLQGAGNLFSEIGNKICKNTSMVLLECNDLTTEHRQKLVLSEELKLLENAS